MIITKDALTWFLLLISGISAVRIRDNTPFDCATPSEGAQYCVDLSKNDSICAPDPMLIWKLTEPSPGEIHAGVAQRIDGTESERNNIKEVLRLMNLYWYEEVLSNFEFSSIRTSWSVQENTFGLLMTMPSARSNAFVALLLATVEIRMSSALFGERLWF
jgi:hypothetical protein